MTRIMAKMDVAAIGASAGGIDALVELLSAFPPEYSGSLLVVVHIAPDSPGIMHKVLGRQTSLTVVTATNGELIKPRHVYVAPPDRHLLVASGGMIVLSNGPKENRFRPAVDPLFRSAALVYRNRAVGVVLSGGLDDGTAGLCAIKQAGGTALVQDPMEAEVASMPQSAITHVDVDGVFSVKALAQQLTELALTDVPLNEGSHEMPIDVEIETQVALSEKHRAAGIERLGPNTQWTCPECHGSLRRVGNGVPLRFRCHTGHAFTAASLEVELKEKIEANIWTAVRILEEHAMLLEEMVAVEKLDKRQADRLIERALDARRRAQAVRDVLRAPADSTIAAE
jgi:two-component system, chemotaxis family, protein-glutamate methylesterase/glutaminase